MAEKDNGVCKQCRFKFRRRLCTSCLDYNRACLANGVKPVVPVCVQIVKAIRTVLVKLGLMKGENENGKS